MYAKEVSTIELRESNRSRIVIKLSDINDNNPEFTSSNFKFKIPLSIKERNEFPHITVNLHNPFYQLTNKEIKKSLI